MSGPGTAVAPGDSEPRAIEVVRAAAALGGIQDPAARWERAVAEPPPLARERAPIGERLELERLVPVDSEPTTYSSASSPELAEDLGQCVPQALLRDLHRLVPVVRRHPLEPIEGSQLLGQWMDWRLAPGEAMRRDPRPAVAAITEVFLEDEARRRELRARPWEPFLRDDEPRNEIRHEPFGGSFF